MKCLQNPATSTTLPLHMGPQMASSSRPMTRSKRLEWSLTRDKTLLQILIELKRSGRWSDSGPRRDSWRLIVNQLNERLPSLPTTREQIKNHLFELKRSYRTVRAMRESGGFEWNDSTQQLLASDPIWEEYIMEHKGAKRFRRTSFPIYDELDELYRDIVSKGKQSTSTMLVDGDKASVPDVPSQSLPEDEMNEMDELYQEIVSKRRQSISTLLANRNKAIVPHMPSLSLPGYAKDEISYSSDRADASRIGLESMSIPTRQNREDVDQSERQSETFVMLVNQNKDGVPHIPSQPLPVDEMNETSNSSDRADVNETGLESTSIPTGQNQEDVDQSKHRSETSIVLVYQNKCGVSHIPSQPQLVDAMNEISDSRDREDVNQIGLESTSIPTMQNREYVDQSNRRSKTSAMLVEQYKAGVPHIPSQPLPGNEMSDSSDRADANQTEFKSTSIPTRQNQDDVDQSKRRPETSSSVRTKRSRSTIDGRLADEFSRLADVRSVASRPPSPNPHGYGACLDEIISMEELTIEERIKLSDLLRDEFHRIAFMKFRGGVRIAWARSHLH